MASSSLITLDKIEKRFSFLADSLKKYKQCRTKSASKQSAIKTQILSDPLLNDKVEQRNQKKWQKALKEKDQRLRSEVVGCTFKPRLVTNRSASKRDLNQFLNDQSKHSARVKSKIVTVASEVDLQRREDARSASEERKRWSQYYVRTKKQNPTTTKVMEEIV